MEIDIFGTNSKKLVKQAIDVYNKQHNAISKNIANVNDPLYKRVKTDFSEELKLAQQNAPLKSSSDKHITQPHYTATLFPQENGRDRVEITKEMADLAENQIRNEFATKRLSRIFSKLQLSIKGRQ
jgi:flagellar basal-body rod protein FlgB